MLIQPQDIASLTILTEADWWGQEAGIKIRNLSWESLAQEVALGAYDCPTLQMSPPPSPPSPPSPPTLLVDAVVFIDSSWLHRIHALVNNSVCGPHISRFGMLSMALPERSTVMNRIAGDYLPKQIQFEKEASVSTASLSISFSSMLNTSIATSVKLNIEIVGSSYPIHKQSEEQNEDKRIEENLRIIRNRLGCTNTSI